MEVDGGRNGPEDGRSSVFRGSGKGYEGANKRGGQGRGSGRISSSDGSLAVVAAWGGVADRMFYFFSKQRPQAGESCRTTTAGAHDRRAQTRGGQGRGVA
jgi:hypothetical protein